MIKHFVNFPFFYCDDPKTGSKYASKASARYPPYPREKDDIPPDHCAIFLQIVWVVALSDIIPKFSLIQIKIPVARAHLTRVPVSFKDHAAEHGHLGYKDAQPSKCELALALCVPTRPIVFK